MNQLINEWKNFVFPIEYAVNKWLEDGIRIEKIDNNFKIAESVDIKFKKKMIYLLQNI